MASVLLINPNTSSDTTAMMLSVARPLLPPGITLSGREARDGAAMIVDEAMLAVAARETGRIGLSAADGFDAVVIAAFGDPGLIGLRARLAIPVIGIGEASMREAAEGGRSFGIATTTPGLADAIVAYIENLGLSARFTGIRLPKADPLALAGDPDRQDAALAEAARQCIEQDGAEAVIIGGGPLSGSARRLRESMAVAVIEPVPAAIRAVLRSLDR